MTPAKTMLDEEEMLSKSLIRFHVSVSVSASAFAHVHFCTDRKNKTCRQADFNYVFPPR